MPRYLTVEQIKAYHRSEIPTADDEYIEAAADASEAFLDQACQRRFVVATTATPRLYVGNDRQVLDIHDCTTVTVASNNGQTVGASGYQLEPVNGLTWAGETRPYDSIRLLNSTWEEGPYTGQATASITATWGWAAIPDRIVQAALIVAKEIITNRDEVKLGLVGFSDVGGVTARTNPIVRDTIAAYKRVEAFGLA
jgi:hypothetical protein